MAKGQGRELEERVLDVTFSIDAVLALRLAALHALAVVAGAQRAAEAKASSAALLSPAAEDALRLAVYAGVGTRTPAEAVLALLHQPLLELRRAAAPAGLTRNVAPCLLPHASPSYLPRPFSKYKLV